MLDECPKCGYDFELKKKMNGTWTIKEIIEAMKEICPEVWSE